MKRPQIINFFKKGTTLAYVHEVYKMNPELWAYIQAVDAACDDMESQLEERDEICEKIISTMDHKDFWDNIQKLEDLMKRKPN